MVAKMKKGIRVGQKKKVMMKAVAKRAPPMVPSLDKEARDFLRLLADPCGSALVGAPYGGIAGTNFFRFRQLINPGASAVDSTVQFCPSLVDRQGSLSAGAGAIQWTSVNTAGATATSLYGSVVSPVIATYVGSLRCIGACIRVLYVGSEFDRRGLVGVNLLTSPIYDGTGDGDGLPGAYYGVPTLQAEMPSVRRLGEVAHEVRWVPGFEDQQFVEIQENPETSASYTPGSAIVASVYNAPPGSIMYEVYTCWETQPNAQVGGMVATVRAPPSRNTLNEVLRTIGNITDFAVNAGHAIVPGIRSSVQFATKYGPGIAAAML